MAFRSIVFVATLGVILTAAGAAQADPQGGACAQDAARFCGEDVSSVARTAACLVAHRAQLSTTCRDVFVSTESVAVPMPGQGDRSRIARVATARHVPRHLAHADPARPERAHRRARLVRRSIPYHIPRFDQAEAEAEVHTQYRYRTPYLPYWVLP